MNNVLRIFNVSIDIRYACLSLTNNRVMFIALTLFLPMLIAFSLFIPFKKIKVTLWYMFVLIAVVMIGVGISIGSIINDSYVSFSIFRWQVLIIVVVLVSCGVLGFVSCGLFGAIFNCTSYC